METIIQKIRKELSREDVAYSYYAIISSINKLGLTDRELQLLSFTALRGGITNPAAKKDFCEKYNSSLATINNMISKLRRLGVFVKKGNKISIHTAISLDFNKNIVLQLCLMINQPPSA
jgi:hypothetical protein